MKKYVKNQPPALLFVNHYFFRVTRPPFQLMKEELQKLINRTLSLSSPMIWVGILGNYSGIITGQKQKRQRLIHWLKMV
jgi:hypothetical protein